MLIEPAGQKPGPNSSEVGRYGSAHALALTARQQRYAELRIEGYPPLVAARLAGYRDNGKTGIRVRAHRLERHAGVQRTVEAMRNAICWRAWQLFRKGVPVSSGALDLLSRWPGISGEDRRRVARAYAFTGMSTQEAG